MHTHDKGLANVRHWMPRWMFRLEDEPDLKCNFYKQKFFPNFRAPPLLARLCKNCIRRFVERPGGADSQQNMEPCNHPWQQQPLVCQQGSRVYKNYPRISKMPQIKTSQKLQMLSPVTFYWRVTMSVDIVVLNCQKCYLCLTDRRSSVIAAESRTVVSVVNNVSVVSADVAFLLVGISTRSCVLITLITCL